MRCRQISGLAHVETDTVHTVSSHHGEPLAIIPLRAPAVEMGDPWDMPPRFPTFAFGPLGTSCARHRLPRGILLACCPRHAVFVLSDCRNLRKAGRSPTGTLEIRGRPQVLAHASARVSLPRTNAQHLVQSVRTTRRGDAGLVTTTCPLCAIGQSSHLRPISFH